MSLTDNPFSSVPSANGWKNRQTLDVFLSHSSDCLKICELVKKYLQDDISNALMKYDLNINPIMYENWPPSLKNGTAEQSSLSGVAFSSVLFAFIYKKHGNIRNKEISYAIELFNRNKIQDVHVFFKKIPKSHKRKADKEVNVFRKSLKEDLTYYTYDNDIDVIKKVSQIIIKAICELKKQEGQTVPDEILLDSGARLSNNNGAGL